jgi:catechol 2,3-dioxygenase-like lactoylglutathione lyase family enzyme
VFNVGGQVNRANATQRPPREPARIERLGHVVLETASFQRALDWYLDNLGLIVSDFLYWPGQRDRGPAMAFIRCDRGSHPGRPPHARDGAGPGSPLRPLGLRGGRPGRAGGGQRVPEGARYQHSWGIGRHIEGSQIFDYWRDPDGFLVEHFADGDMFDNTVETGWAQMSASHLNQWGRPVTKSFLAGSTPSLQTIRHLVSALADPTNEFDLHRRLRPAEGGHVMSIR